MPSFLADENFDRHLLRGLIRRRPETDIVRVQDMSLRQAKDAERGLVRLTHDASTIPDLAYARIRNDQRMPGVLVVRKTRPMGVLIEQILIVIECTADAEWADRVHYMPI